MIVYVVTEGSYDSEVCGVYSTQEKAEQEILKNSKYNKYAIYPFHLDGNLWDSHALYFVSRYDGDRYIITPLDTELIDGYPLHEPKILTLSTGEIVAHVSVRADCIENAKEIAIGLFKEVDK